MGKPIDQVREYHEHDALSASDFNAVVAVARARQLGGDGAWSPDGGAWLGRQVRTSQDLDGVYDIPVFTTDGVRIPPFSVVQPTWGPAQDASSKLFNVGGTSYKRGVAVTKWAAGNYSPRFMVLNEYGIPGTSGTRYGLASDLHNGGFVAVSLEDDQGNAAVPGSTVVDPNHGTFAALEATWGPKSGSFLLWPGYNGFYVLQPSFKYVDPFDASTINVCYAYQSPGLVGASAFGTDTGTLTVSTTPVEFAAAPTVMGVTQKHVTNPLTTRTQVYESGVYRYTVCGVIKPDNSTLATWPYLDGTDFVVSIESWRDNFGTPLQVGPTQLYVVTQVKDAGGNFVKASVTVAYTGLVNLKYLEKFFYKIYSNRNVSASRSMSFIAHATLHRIDNWNDGAGLPATF